MITTHIMLLGWKRHLWRTAADLLVTLRLIDEARWAYSHANLAEDNRRELMLVYISLVDDDEDDEDDEDLT